MECTDWGADRIVLLCLYCTMLQTGLWMHCLWTGLSVGSKAIGSDTIRAWVSQLGLSAHLPEVYVKAHKPDLASHCLKLIIGGSCHKYHFCHDNSFVTTDPCFVMTSILLSWQNTSFVMTNTCLLWQKLVATKILSQQNITNKTVVTSIQWWHLGWAHPQWDKFPEN